MIAEKIKGLDRGKGGEAKIIPILHGRLVQQFSRAWTGCRLTLTSPEYHFAKRGFLYAVLGGSAIAIRGSSDLPAARLCAALGADTIVCMAAHARELVAEAGRTGRLPPGTVVQFSGSRSSAPMRRELLEHVCDGVAVTYSMQECGSIARTVERSVGDVSESVGRPHPGIEVEIVDEARSTALEEGKRIVDSSRQDAAQEKSRARDELRKDVASLAVAGASRLLQREIDPKAHADLIEQLAREIEGAKA